MRLQSKQTNKIFKPDRDGIFHVEVYCEYDETDKEPSIYEVTINYLNKIIDPYEENRMEVFTFSDRFKILQ